MIIDVCLRQRRLACHLSVVESEVLAVSLRFLGHIAPGRRTSPWGRASSARGCLGVHHDHREDHLFRNSCPAPASRLAHCVPFCCIAKDSLDDFARFHGGPQPSGRPRFQRWVDVHGLASLAPHAGLPVATSFARFLGPVNSEAAPLTRSGVCAGNAASAGRYDPDCGLLEPRLVHSLGCQDFCRLPTLGRFQQAYWPDQAANV